MLSNKFASCFDPWTATLHFCCPSRYKLSNRSFHDVSPSCLSSSFENILVPNSYRFHRICLNHVSELPQRMPYNKIKVSQISFIVKSWRGTQTTKIENKKKYFSVNMLFARYFECITYQYTAGTRTADQVK